MNELEKICIYDPAGANYLLGKDWEFPITDKCERSAKIMGDDFVRLVFESTHKVVFDAFSFIRYNGQTFFLREKYIPKPKGTFKEDSGEVSTAYFSYDVKFVSVANMLDKYVCYRHVKVSGDNGGEWNEPEININGNLETMYKIIMGSIQQVAERLSDHMEFTSMLKTIPANGLNSDGTINTSKVKLTAGTKLLTFNFSGDKIANVCTTVANNFTNDDKKDTEWYITEDNGSLTLHFAKYVDEEYGVQYVSDYISNNNGADSFAHPQKSGGLKDVDYAQEWSGITNVIVPYGSTRNMTYQAAKGIDEVTQMQSTFGKRLRLKPNTYYYVKDKDGKDVSFLTDKQGAVRNSSVDTGIEEVRFYDEIYPQGHFRVTKVETKNKRQDGEIVPEYTVAGVAIDSSGNEIQPAEGFYPIAIEEGATLSVRFEKGLLNGREFEIANKTRKDEGRTTYSLKFTIVADGSLEDGTLIPSGNFIPREGDEFALFNMKMPEVYITAAEKELAQRVYSDLEEAVSKRPEVKCTTDPTSWDKEMALGYQFQVKSEKFNSEDTFVSRVISYSYKLTKPKEIQFNLASAIMQGTLSSMSDQIADVTHQAGGLEQRAINLSRRGWRDAAEMAEMVDSLAADMMLVGNEKYQFAFTAGIEIVNSNNQTTAIKIGEGTLQHTQDPYISDYTCQGWWSHGAVTLNNGHTENGSASLVSLPDTPFYLYAVVGQNSDNISFELQDQEQDGEAYLLLGILSSAFADNGTNYRVFNRTNGYTQISGGTITTEQIQDAGRNLIIDFQSNPPRIIARNGAEIIGNIKFKASDEMTAEEQLAALGVDVSNALSTVEQSVYANIYNGGDISVSTDGSKEIALKDAFIKISTLGCYVKFTKVRETPLAPSSGSCIVAIKKGIDISQIYSHLDDIYAYLNWGDEYTPTEECDFYVVLAEKDYLQYIFENTLNTIECDAGVWTISGINVIVRTSDAIQSAMQAIANEEDARTEALAAAVSNINGGIDELQKQIDGEVNSWFMEGEPANNYRPANEWTDQTLKNRHLGDTYTNILPADVDLSTLDSNGTLQWVEQGYLQVGSAAFEKTYAEQRQISSNFCRTKCIMQLANTATKITITPKDIPSGYTFKVLFSFYNAEKKYYTNDSWKYNNDNSSITYNVPAYGNAYGGSQICYFSILFIAQDSDGKYLLIKPSNIASIESEVVFANPEAGKSWRWCNYDDEDNTTFHWHPIADSDAVKALQEAAKAQSTADGKSTTFVAEPKNYDIGDLWILAADRTLNGTTYKQGTILTANAASATFVASHWGEKVKYTDDTVAQQAVEAAANAKTAADNAQADATAAAQRLNDWATDGVISPVEKQGIKDEKARIDADKTQISNSCTQYGVSISSFETAYNNYANVLNSIIDAATEIVTIPSNFKTAQSEYYTQRTSVLDAISKKAQEVAEVYARQQAQQALDGLELGGENLILESKGDSNKNIRAYNASASNEFQYSCLPTKSDAYGDELQIGLTCSTQGKYTPDSYSYTTCIWVQCKKEIIRGKRYTISFDARLLETSSNTNCTIFFRAAGTGYSTTQMGKAIIDKVKKRYSITVDSNDESDTNVYSYFTLFLDRTTNIYISNVKVEQGNKATGWSPAPEDVDSKADAIKAIAEEAKEDAAESNAQLANMSNDSILTPQEKGSVADEWACIQEEYSQNSTNKTTAWGSDTVAEWTAYNNAYTTLQTYVGTLALTDRTNNTTIVKSTFQANFANYYSANVAFLNALSKKVAELEVAAMEIGGRNLLKNSNVFSIIQWGTSNATYTKGTEYATMKMNVAEVMSTCTWARNVTHNKDYIYNKKWKDKNICISVAVKSSKDIGLKVGIVIRNSSNVNISQNYYNAPYINVKAGEWTRIYSTYKCAIDADADNVRTIYLIIGSSTTCSIGDEFNIKDWKIEFGTKATDWTPAPEDVDAKVSALDYLKEALENDTDVTGGIVATTHIQLRDWTGKYIDKNGTVYNESGDGRTKQYKVNAGLSGLDDDNVLAWGGGDYEDAVEAAKNSDPESGDGTYNKKDGSEITTLIKKDGTGKIGIFKISETQAVVDVPNQGKVIIDASTANGGMRLYDNYNAEKIVITPKSIKNHKSGTAVIEISDSLTIASTTVNSSSYTAFSDGFSVVYDQNSIRISYNVSAYFYFRNIGTSYTSAILEIKLQKSNNGTTWQDVQTIETTSGSRNIDFANESDPSIYLSLNNSKEINNVGWSNNYRVVASFRETTSNNHYIKINNGSASVSGECSDESYSKTIIFSDGLLTEKALQSFKVDNSGTAQKIFAKGLSNRKGTAGSGELYVSDSFLNNFKDFLDELNSIFEDVRFVGNNKEYALNIAAKISTLKASIDESAIIASS